MRYLINVIVATIMMFVSIALWLGSLVIAIISFPFAVADELEEQDKADTRGKKLADGYMVQLNTRLKQKSINDEWNKFSVLQGRLDDGETLTQEELAHVHKVETKYNEDCHYYR